MQGALEALAGALREQFSRPNYGDGAPD